MNSFLSGKYNALFFVQCELMVLYHLTFNCCEIYLELSPYLIFTFSPRKYLFHVGTFEHVNFFPCLYPGTVNVTFIGASALHLCSITRLVFWQCEKLRDRLCDSVALVKVCVDVCKVLMEPVRKGTSRGRRDAQKRDCWKRF